MCVTHFYLNQYSYETLDRKLIPFFGGEPIHFLTNFQQILFLPVIFLAGRVGIVIDSTVTERRFRPWSKYNCNTILQLPVPCVKLMLGFIGAISNRSQTWECMPRSSPLRCNISSTKTFKCLHCSIAVASHSFSTAFRKSLREAVELHHRCHRRQLLLVASSRNTRLLVSEMGQVVLWWSQLPLFPPFIPHAIKRVFSLDYAVDTCKL